MADNFWESDPIETSAIKNGETISLTPEQRIQIASLNRTPIKQGDTVAMAPGTPTLSQDKPTPQDAFWANDPVDKRTVGSNEAFRRGAVSGMAKSVIPVAEMADATSPIYDETNAQRYKRTHGGKGLNPTLTGVLTDAIDRSAIQPDEQLATTNVLGADVPTAAISNAAGNLVGATPAILAENAAGGPLAAFAGGAASGFEERKRQLVNAGMSPDMADGAAAVSGIAEGLMQSVPLGAAGGIGKRVLTGAAAMGVAGPVSRAAENLTIPDDRPDLKQDVETVGDATGDLLLGGMMHGAFGHRGEAPARAPKIDAEGQSLLRDDLPADDAGAAPTETPAAASPAPPTPHPLDARIEGLRQLLATTRTDAGRKSTVAQLNSLVAQRKADHDAAAMEEQSEHQASLILAQRTAEIDELERLAQAAGDRGDTEARAQFLKDADAIKQRTPAADKTKTSVDGVESDTAPANAENVDLATPEEKTGPLPTDGIEVGYPKVENAKPGKEPVAPVEEPLSTRGIEVGEVPGTEGIEVGEQPPVSAPERGYAVDSFGRAVGNPTPAETVDARARRVPDPKALPPPAAQDALAAPQGYSVDKSGVATPGSAPVRAARAAEVPDNGLDDSTRAAQQQHPAWTRDDSSVAAEAGGIEVDEVPIDAVDQLTRLINRDPESAEQLSQEHPHDTTAFIAAVRARNAELDRSAEPEPAQPRAAAGDGQRSEPASAAPASAGESAERGPAEGEVGRRGPLAASRSDIEPPSREGDNGGHGQRIPEFRPEDVSPVRTASAYPAVPVWDSAVGALRRAISRFIGRDLPADEFTRGELPFQQRQVIGAIARLFGQKVVVFRQREGSALPIEGVVIRDGTIYINEDSQRPHVAVMMHELLHSLRKDEPAMYARLFSALADRLGDTEAYRNNRMGGSEESVGTIHEEMVADHVADHASDGAFWSDLAKRIEQKEPGLWPKVARYIGAFIDRIAGTRTPMESARYIRDFQASRDAILDTLADYSSKRRAMVESESTGDPRFSRQQGDENEGRSAEPSKLPRDESRTGGLRGSVRDVPPKPADARANADGRVGSPPRSNGALAPEADRAGRLSKPLDGAPGVVTIRGTSIELKPFLKAREAAERYMESAGLPYDPPRTYAPVDVDRAHRIADEYAAMKHDPADPGRTDQPAVESQAEQGAPDGRTNKPAFSRKSTDGGAASDDHGARSSGLRSGDEGRSERVPAAGRSDLDAAGSAKPAVRGEDSAPSVIAPDAPRYGRPTKPGAVDVVGVHYSMEPNLKSLDGMKFGQNPYTSEVRRLGKASEKNPLTQRVYFYEQGEKGKLPEPESVVGGQHAYRTSLRNIYDLSADPRGIIDRLASEGRATRDEIEEEIHARGYNGYINREHADGKPAIVLLGAKKVPAEYLGTRGALKDAPSFSRKDGDSSVSDLSDARDKRELGKFRKTLGESVAERAQKMADETVAGGHKYEVGDRVESEGGRPFKILGKTMSEDRRNLPPVSEQKWSERRAIIKSRPKVPAYRVETIDRTPDQEGWAQYDLPEHAITKRFGEPLRSVDGAANDPKFSRKTHQPDKELSTRVPTNKGQREDHRANFLGTDLDVAKSTPASFEKNVDAVTQYPNYRPAKGAVTAEQKADRFIEHVKSNLLHIYDQVPPAIRERSKLWYVGAHKIAGDFSKRFGVPDDAAAGVIAVLSPQKDWHMNVSLAERVMGTIKDRGDHVWDDDMTHTALVGYKNGPGVYSKPEFADAIQGIIGKRLNELTSPFERALWIRTYDQAHESQSFKIRTPEGNDSAPKLNKDGKEGSVIWGDNASIAKAVSIADNPTRDNIDMRLGGEHKVRSFYNNIISPDSPRGAVTIDTHAVAAGLLRPLSGTSVEVGHNFGSAAGSSYSAKTGLGGTYPLYAEAYRRAAAERGVLPREMQSVMWEAARGLFQGPFKRDRVAPGKIDDAWNRYSRGGVSLEHTRNTVQDLAGGIDNPDWTRSGAGLDAREGQADGSPDVPPAQLAAGNPGPDAGRARGADAGGVPPDDVAPSFSRKTQTPPSAGSSTSGNANAPAVTKALTDDGFTRAFGRGVIDQSYATLARVTVQAERALADDRATFDRMLGTKGGADRIRKAINQWETNKPVTDPVLGGFFKTMKAAFDQRVAAVIAGGREMGYLDNYFPHLYKDVKKATEWFQNYNARRPMEGGAGYTKERFYETLDDARKAGLVPISENPVDMMQAHLGQMDKYICLHQIRTELEKRGYVMDDDPKAFRKPEGWAKVNDPAFNGKLVPELIAKDLNSNLGATLNDSAVFRGFRKVENSAVSAALGFSGFHATMTTGDTIASHIGDGIQRAAMGDVPGAAKSLGMSLISPIVSPIKGKALLKQSLGETPKGVFTGMLGMNKQADAHTAALFRMLEMGGSQPFMSHTELNDSAVKLSRLMRQKQYLQAPAELLHAMKSLSAGQFKDAAGHLHESIATPLEALHALAENITPLIHKHLVPSQKMTAKILNLKTELDALAGKLGKQRGDYAGIEQAMSDTAIRQIAGKVVSQVDDRLGQMNYRRLYINRMSRDILQAAFMSPGWQIGTVNTIGGGLKDVGKLALGGDVIHGPLDKAGTITDARQARLTGRTAYLLGLHALVASVAIGTTYALTGQGPGTDIRNYFTIRTGRKNDDGTDERLTFPSYLKDEVELADGGHVVKNAYHMIGNKMNPVFRLLGELGANKDYFGNRIYDPDADSSTQAEQVGKHIASMSVPFSVTGIKKAMDNGAGPGTIVANVMGVNPAPGYMTRTPFFDFLAEHRDDHGHEALNPDGAAAKTKFFRALHQIRSGQDPDLSGLSDADQAKLVKYSQTSAPVAAFRRLSLQQKLAAWDHASDEERAQYGLQDIILAGKISDELAKLPKEESDKAQAELEAIEDWKPRAEEIAGAE